MDGGGFVLQADGWKVTIGYKTADEGMVVDRGKDSVVDLDLFLQIQQNARRLWKYG
jgi:hypothetical protein